MMKTNDLDIIFEDNHIIVVNKPANILSQKDKTNDTDMLDIIKEYLKIKYQKPGNVYLGLVHRLDRRVSGVMVFAKTSKAASRLSESIRSDQVEKKYYAIVTGKMDNEGELIHYLKKVETNDGPLALITKESDKEAKIAKLKYRLIKEKIIDGVTFSLLEINLITGRYNQIRAQLAAIKHPIINDYKYGYRGINYNDELGLACIEMKLVHPTTKELKVFKSVPQTGIWLNFLEE